MKFTYIKSEFSSIESPSIATLNPAWDILYNSGQWQKSDCVGMVTVGHFRLTVLRLLA
ncbi:5035_t:CDS:2, partial [Racocetra persica]